MTCPTFTMQQDVFHHITKFDKGDQDEHAERLLKEVQEALHDLLDCTAESIIAAIFSMNMEDRVDCSKGPLAFKLKKGYCGFTKESAIQLSKDRAEATNWLKANKKGMKPMLAIKVPPAVVIHVRLAQSYKYRIKKDEVRCLARDICLGIKHIVIKNTESSGKESKPAGSMRQLALLASLLDTSSI